MKLSISLIFTCILCFYGAGTSAQQRLTPLQFITLLQQDSLIQLLDVRTPKEYQAGYIPFAKNLDWTKKDTFEAGIQDLAKNKPIYIYCLSGGRSNKAAIKLKELGFDVYELDGGIVNWRKENLPESSPKKIKESLSFLDYQQLILSHDQVLINFSAVWCIPCQEMKPFLQKIQQDRKTEVNLITIDADEQKALLKVLKVNALPAFKLYKKGVLVWEHSGQVTEELLLEKITQP